MWVDIELEFEGAKEDLVSLVDYMLVPLYGIETSYCNTNGQISRGTSGHYQVKFELRCDIGHDERALITTVAADFPNVLISGRLAHRHKYNSYTEYEVVKTSSSGLHFEKDGSSVDDDEFDELILEGTLGPEDMRLVASDVSDIGSMVLSLVKTGRSYAEIRKGFEGHNQSGSIDQMVIDALLEVSESSQTEETCDQILQSLKQAKLVYGDEYENSEVYRLFCTITLQNFRAVAKRMASIPLQMERGDR